LVRLFPRRPKGPFDELPARKPITITASAPPKLVLRMKLQVPSCYPVWGQVSRPCTLGIVGLAIAVFLWGFGYKLSLYHPHPPSSSRASVAKLWIDPHSASVATTSRLKAKSHLLPDSQAWSVSVPRLPCLGRAIVFILPLCERRIALFDFLIPSRAPPPYRFRLA
jgi:hypothetical protein